jgi:hypothetical protein
LSLSSVNYPLDCAEAFYLILNPIPLFWLSLFVIIQFPAQLVNSQAISAQTKNQGVWE